MAALQAASLPVSAVLLLGVNDPEWGQRLVALVGSSDAAVLQRLELLTRPWPAAETPRRWLLSSFRCRRQVRFCARPPPKGARPGRRCREQAAWQHQRLRWHSLLRLSLCLSTPFVFT